MIIRQIGWLHSNSILLAVPLKCGRLKKSREKIRQAGDKANKQICRLGKIILATTTSKKIKCVLAANRKK